MIKKLFDGSNVGVADVDHDRFMLTGGTGNRIIVDGAIGLAAGFLTLTGAPIDVLDVSWLSKPGGQR
ncbi:hypothetical protein ACFSWE_10255 [Leucobacter albus]|uniref:MBL fold metallo-hydrolase n=1 Tax=Leucobacter albus TaxID=272210 RepID=A0ABW3TI49_9MICO